MPNNDLILRADVLDLMQSYGPATYDMPYGSGDMIIRPEDVMALPAVDAAPVVHGRWIKMTGMMPPEYHGHYECSECQWHMKGLRNSWTREEEMAYCPNCGAQMDGDDDG